MSATDAFQLAQHHFGPGLWVVLAVFTSELINLITFRKLNAFGIIPRESAGLPGIALAPLLHTDIKHFLANFPPLVVLCFALGKLMPTQFWWILATLTLGTGLLVWLLARRRIHVGASGLVYALFGYLTLHGYVTGNVIHVIVAVALLVLYSGFLWGAIRMTAQTSWESHLAGLLVGGGLAWWNIF